MSVLPAPMQQVKAAGLPVWADPYDANLVAFRHRGAPLDTFDGRLVLAWVIQGGAWRMVDVRAATRPGTYYLRNPMNPLGTAMLAPGRNVLSHELGFHRGGAALVQRAPVRIYRDADLDAVLDPPLDPYDADGAGINIHEIGNPAYLAGCIGVPALELAEVLQAWRQLRAARPQDRVSLSVVEI